MLNNRLIFNLLQTSIRGRNKLLEKKSFVVFAVFLFVLVFAAAVPAAGADPGTVILKDVLTGAETTYENISDAVEAASPGSTITVGAGEYAEAFVIDKTLTINGDPGAKIIGTNQEFVVDISASGVTLNGLEIVCPDDGNESAAIRLSFDNFTGSSPVTITNCLLNGNMAADNGIEGRDDLSNGTLIVEGNIIKNFYYEGINLYEHLDEIEESSLTFRDNKIYNDPEEGLLSYGIDLDVDHFNNTILIEGNEIEAEYEAIYFYNVYESTVEITGNELLVSDDDGSYCIYMPYFEDSVVTMAGNNISGNGGIDLDYLYSSAISITDNSITSSDCNPVYLYWVEDETTVEITGNEITNDDERTCIYAYYFLDSVVTISENDLVGEWGFWVDYVESSGVTVDGNSIESTYDAVGFYDVYNNSSFTVTNNDMVVLEPGNCGGVYGDYLKGSTLTVENNDISAEYGILLYDLWNAYLAARENTFAVEEGAVVVYYAEDGLMEVEENSIATANVGFAYDEAYGCEIKVSGNTINAAAAAGEEARGIIFGYDDSNGYIIYGFDQLRPNAVGSPAEPSGKSSGKSGKKATPSLQERQPNFKPMQGWEEASNTIEVADNIICGFNAGIYAYALYDNPETAATVAIHGNRLEDNVTGLEIVSLDYTRLDSSLTIFNNSFAGNEVGLWIGSGDYSGTDIFASLNSFTGNTEAAVVTPDGFDATLNWWGSPDGPSEGEVIGAIYDPWLSEVKLATSGSKLKDKGENTLTATLYDSNGNVVKTGLLKILFTVSGANNLSEVVALVDGVAVFKYRDQSPGTDTISAGVLFAGVMTGLESEKKQVLWQGEEKKPEPPGELPRTSGSSRLFLAFLLPTLLLAGGMLLIKRKAAKAW